MDTYQQYSLLCEQLARKSCSVIESDFVSKAAPQFSRLTEIATWSITKLGATGSMQLAFVGSFRGTNYKKLKRIAIDCSGEIKGKKTIRELVQMNVLARQDESYEENEDKVFINRVAAAFPFAGLIYMHNASNKSRNSYTRKIKTSLPVELQYLQAAALPLGPNTRKAHVLWSIKFSQVLNRTFRGEIYQLLMKRSELYVNALNITKLLVAIEELVTLDNEEESVDVSRTLNHYNQTVI
ncbi:hypothetical protein A0J61_06982 [Choanephora cucurbitarum]|uniref:Uncharacterized protein n=1 Tax=Choanephora cucurbitarum TaxID=101091 RepID=A0A1C7N761_9FUNG|nr:hypothetical protein A0J61_06982 [Choanephora cucurbitarum]